MSKMIRIELNSARFFFVLIRWFFSFTGNKVSTINLGSYNYLGFANNNGPIAENVINCIKSEALATASSSQEFGLLRIVI